MTVHLILQKDSRQDIHTQKHTRTSWIKDELSCPIHTSKLKNVNTLLGLIFHIFQ